VSDIPQARARLEQLMKDTPDLALHAELAEIVALLKREPYAKPRARPRTKTVGPDLAHRIRVHVRDNPDHSILEVANLLGTNPGRVSEALHGKR
jgi:hypothetical protein